MLGLTDGIDSGLASSGLTAAPVPEFVRPGAGISPGDRVEYTSLHRLGTVVSVDELPHVLVKFDNFHTFHMPQGKYLVRVEKSQSEQAAMQNEAK